MSRGLRVLAGAVLLVSWNASGAHAQDIPRGTIIDDLKCAADPAQSYDYVGAEGIARAQKRGLWLFR